MTTNLDLAWLEHPDDYIWRDEFHSLIDCMAEMAKTEISLRAEIARLKMAPPPKELTVADIPPHMHPAANIYNDSLYQQQLYALMGQRQLTPLEALYNQQAIGSAYGFSGLSGTLGGIVR